MMEHLFSLHIHSPHPQSSFALWIASRVSFCNTRCNAFKEFLQFVNLNCSSLVVAMARKLESGLIKSGSIAAYNEELQDFVDRGVLCLISEDEMQAWQGPVNYICHHRVEKLQSASTKLRVVSNSSLDNCNQGMFYNDIVPKGPNSLVPLHQAILYWRSNEECVVWDLRKTYNDVHTFEEELHCRRLVWR